MSAAIIANLSGRLSGALVSTIFIPLYLRLIGPEGYGIVGLNVVLINIFLFLDGGVLLTLNREMARLSSTTSNVPQMRRILSAATAIMMILACLAATILWFAAPWIASRWLNVHTLSPQSVVLSIRLIGFVVAEQLIISLCQGALFGLHRQVAVNVVLIMATTLRAVGVLAVLRYISATPSAFFFWYALISLLQIVALRLLVARDIPFTRSVVWPRIESIKELLRHSAGVGGVALLSLLLSQIDKILVSRVLPLQDFGYYMVGVSVAQVPLMIAIPIAAAVFPRLAQLASNDKKGAQRLFHASARIIAALVVPIGFTLIFFGHELIFAWTGRIVVTQHVAPIAGILAMANSINGILQISYYHEMAHARTRLIICFNIFAVIFLVPGIMILAHRYGGPGAASCWLALNLSYLFVAVPIIMWRSLGRDVARFYTVDLLPSIVITLLVTGLVRILAPAHLARVQGGTVALATLAIATIACVLAAPEPRERIGRALRKTTVFRVPPSMP
jgi:O-antigen/teichoic acid export membrane protein